VEKFVRGSIVVLPFPFSDLSDSKRRPALVVGTPDGKDIILCQITSKKVRDQYAVTLAAGDLSEGDLSVASNVRPNRIFTADRKIIIYQLGQLKPKKLKEVVECIVEIVTGEE
jgi:mRNA interferase MazF